MYTIVYTARYRVHGCVRAVYTVECTAVYTARGVHGRVRAVYMARVHGPYTTVDTAHVPGCYTTVYTAVYRPCRLNNN